MEYKRAVLLMAHGGPDTLEDVEPFLFHIMKGRVPAPDFVSEIRERYRQIGGRSPLREITQMQARGLEKALGADGLRLRVYVGMRHWHPFLSETVQRICADGVESLVALPLAPHESKMSVGAYFAELESCLKLAAPPKVIPIRSYCDHPLLIKAILERIEEVYAAFPDEITRSIQILFTAHSLPEKILEENDPYPRELEKTVQGILRELLSEHPDVRWHFAYQSRGRIPGNWLGPEVDSMIPKLSAEGCRHLLIVPIGFVSDHIEVLYDIDILYKGLAKRSGIDLLRTTSLNDHPTFIAALADRVKSALACA